MPTGKQYQCTCQRDNRLGAALTSLTRDICCVYKVCLRHPNPPSIYSPGTVATNPSTSNIYLPRQRSTCQFPKSAPKALSPFIYPVVSWPNYFTMADSHIHKIPQATHSITFPTNPQTGHSIIFSIPNDKMVASTPKINYHPVTHGKNIQIPYILRWRWFLRCSI